MGRWWCESTGLVLGRSEGLAPGWACRYAPAAASGPTPSRTACPPVHVLVGMVGGAHEGAGGDVLEAELIRGALQRGELVGMPVADDGEVALGGAQVLPDGEHLHAMLAQNGKRIHQLVMGLAEADHQPGLGHDLAFAELAREAQDATGAQKLRAAPRERVEARDDLDVVVEDVRALCDHASRAASPGPGSRA